MLPTYIIMPAYRPAPDFPELVSSICDRGYHVIVVYDLDHNAPDDTILSSMDTRATVLCNPSNVGKGVAIRTGLAYIRDHFLINSLETGGTVAIMSANGMYTVQDLDHLLTAATSAEGHGKLTLGVRVFTEKTPFLSHIGNIVTRALFHLLVHTRVSDTLTGLRAFDVSLLPTFLEVEGERSEYEMNQLTYCARHEIGFCEVPVERDHPRGVDNFHLLRDSLRIYLGLFKFVRNSFLSFLVDFALFCLLSFLLTSPLPATGDLIANVIARVISASMSYLLNCKYVFKRRPDRRSAVQFALLTAGILCLNSMVLYLWKLTPIPTQICKLLTEIIMFFVNYMVQNKIIFRKKREISPE